MLGFTPNELEQYFHECLKSKPETVQTLLERIRENPVVEGSCYLPLTASIVAHVFLSGNYLLPSSNHGIFTSVVKFILSRYMQDRLHMSSERASVSSLEALPQNLQSLFVQICKLAYYGVTENKITFVSDDFASVGVNLRVCEIGLIQTIPSILVESKEFYYMFLHLSIQELLAAIHISHMSVPSQLSVFSELFDNPRFTAVFQFYAGITKLKTCRPVLSLLPNFMFPNTPRGMQDIIAQIVRNGEKSQTVCLINCLYETEDPSLCIAVANLLGCKFDFSYTTLTPVDCLSVGYFLSVVSTSISGEFSANFYECSIGNQGCKLLTLGFDKCVHSQSKFNSHFELQLVNNDIYEDGVYYIGELLKNVNAISILILTNNPIGERGLKILCEALLANTMLMELHLSHCSITITEHSGLSLCQLLSTNSTLRCLNLAFNKLGNFGFIAAGLSKNKALKTLLLFSSRLTNTDVEDLSRGLNNYVEELDISENYLVTIKGLTVLAARLNTLCGLKSLKIPIHLRSSIKTVFSIVNEERMKNGLPRIEVIGKCICSKL